MKKWVALLFVCIFANSFSQTNVSPQFSELKGMEDQLGTTITSKSNYLDLFPLQVGNFWQYKVKYVLGFYPNDTTIFYAYREVLKDTLMINGKVYFEIADTRDYIFYHNNFLRIDSATGCIYEYSYYQNKEYLIDSLKMMTGDTILIGDGYPLECISVDTMEFFGVNRQTKHFSCPIVPLWFDYKYAESIGEIYRFNHFENIVVEEYQSGITYAKIDGIEFGQLVSVENEFVNINSFSLFQNYPNPFNPRTCIQYAIGNRQFVTLKVYDALGNEIATLVNEEKPAGEYEVEFDANNLSSGIYFYQLKAGSFTQTKKMILMK